MNNDQQISKTFKCQFNLRTLHEKLNEQFGKETGWGYSTSLDKDARRSSPDSIRGTINGIIDRRAIFEPAFLLKNISNDMYEFSYILRGRLESNSGNDRVNAPFERSLNALLKSNMISDLSEQKNSWLDKNKLIQLGF